MLNIKEYYDPDTGTFSYLLSASESGECIVIDPVLKYDLISGHTSNERINPIINDIETNEYDLVWVLETHAHADHLTAAQQLKAQFGAKVGIGRGIIDIQENFKNIYGFKNDFDTTGKAFDSLFQEGDKIALGNYEITVLATPGHTRDSISYHIDKYLFIGDTLFHPTAGTARCDFPGGDAALLYSSIEKILAFPEHTRLCLCHDYPGNDRKPETYITVAQMRENIHLEQSDNNSEKFITLRKERDATLNLPKLIIPSIQVNAQAGIDESEFDQPLVWPINRF